MYIKNVPTFQEDNYPKKTIKVGGYYDFSLLLIATLHVHYKTHLSVPLAVANAPIFSSQASL